MGVVLLGVDRERDRRVAIKVLQHVEPLGLLRFKTEFRSVAGLRHDNLVTVHELGNHEGLYYLAMEYVDGVDFARWVRYQDHSMDLQDAEASDEATNHPTTAPFRPTLTATPELDDTSLDTTSRLAPSSGSAEERAVAPRDYERLRAAFVQLVRGVQALHRAKLLHLDLKPSNVMVTA